MRKVIDPDNKDIKAIEQLLIECALLSTCKRSKCGSVIVIDSNVVIGEGFNSMPLEAEGDCFKDSLAPTFKSDKTCCIHAEQRAVMDALKHNHAKLQDKSCTIFFLRLDENDKPIKAGNPYCTICSKMALDVGISYFVLYQEEGWVLYDTKYYNELSFQYK